MKYLVTCVAAFLSISLAAVADQVSPKLRVAPALLVAAVDLPPPRWTYIDGKYTADLKATFAMQFVAVAAHDAPEFVVEGKPLAEVLADKLRFVLFSPLSKTEASTHEPPVQGGIGGWTNNAVAQCLLLARRTPAVWEKLNDAERSGADLLMQALAVAAHYSLDDDNDFYVLLDGKSYYHRSWNPNHVGGQVGIITAASLYFGADVLDRFFLSFDFDAFVRRLDAANFQNIRRCWTRDARIRGLLMNGGSITLGSDAVLARGVTTSGAGVRNRFTYDGIPLDQPWRLHRAEAVRLFSKAARTVVTIQGTNTSRLLHRATSAEASPVEGQMGMCHEFESTDWDGLRTSAQYAYEGAMIDLCTASTLKVLGEWRADDGGDMIERRMAVGMTDLRFKLAEGYRGWSQGKEHFTWWEKDIEPMGGAFVFGLWEAYFRTAVAPQHAGSP